jgi:hypothetical protein
MTSDFPSIAYVLLLRRRNNAHKPVSLQSVLPIPSSGGMRPQSSRRWPLLIIAWMLKCRRQSGHGPVGIKHLLAPLIRHSNDHPCMCAISSFKSHCAARKTSSELAIARRYSGSRGRAPRGSGPITLPDAAAAAPLPSCLLAVRWPSHDGTSVVS